MTVSRDTTFILLLFCLFAACKMSAFSQAAVHTVGSIQNTREQPGVPIQNAAPSFSAEKQNAGKPDSQSGSIDTAGKPDNSGKPDNQSGSIDTAGKPDNSGKPDSQSGSADSPEATLSADNETAACSDRIALDIPVPEPDHEHIQKYLEEYQTPYSARWLTSVLEAAAPYRSYVRQQLAANGLPACLEYLPVIESEYKPTAKSRSGALGIWQFMENSIYPFLEKNEWVDERLDPWKSTDAAIEKLKDNYKWFNDWSLALAAYNYGAGGISRLIARAGGTDDFWYLSENNYLTSQTALYVPKFLAVAELVTNETCYGLEFPKITDSDMLTWDEITVTKSIPLQALADALQLDTSILQFLNPALLRGRTPPATEYQLRVPAGTGEEAAEAVSRMELPSYELTYTVVKGDTLWGISRRYGLTVQDLCEANNIAENAILPIGKVLYVPIIE